MVGELPTLVEQDKKRPDGQLLVKVEHCSVPGGIAAVSVEVHANEVVGIAGLVGAGRSTLLRAIAGAEPKATGRMSVKGHLQGGWPRTPHQAHGSGYRCFPRTERPRACSLAWTSPTT